MQRPSDTDPVDVLIIGAGASGAAVAWSLADTRMRIVCFEQGDWTHSSEYPSARKDWESQQFGPYNINPNVRGLETDYPINNDESPINVVNFNGVGGGNAAITEALQVSKFASRVTVIHRRNQLRATRILQEKAFAEPKIEFLWDTVVEKIDGEDFVKSIALRQLTTGQESGLDVAGIFVSIGFKPNTDYLKGILPLDDTGAIITDDRLETVIPGIFAAGDIRHNSGRQVIAAAADGAIAAMNVEKFITESG